LIELESQPLTAFWIVK